VGISPSATAITTLYDWMLGFLQAAEGLDAALSQRSASRKMSRSPAVPLRSSTLSLLTRMRASLQDEIALNPTLPRDLEARIFGYFDEIAALNEGAARTGNGTGKDPAGEAAPKAA